MAHFVATLASAPADHQTTSLLKIHPGVHDAIAWGNTNRPITPENFAKIEAMATEYLGKKRRTLSVRWFRRCRRDGTD